MGNAGLIWAGIHPRRDVMITTSSQTIAVFVRGAVIVVPERSIGFEASEESSIVCVLGSEGEKWIDRLSRPWRGSRIELQFQEKMTWKPGAWVEALL